jgi:hypothetical protein
LATRRPTVGLRFQRKDDPDDLPIFEDDLGKCKKALREKAKDDLDDLNYTYPSSPSSQPAGARGAYPQHMATMEKAVRGRPGRPVMFHHASCFFGDLSCPASCISAWNSTCRAASFQISNRLFGLKQSGPFALSRSLNFAFLIMVSVSIGPSPQSANRFANKNGGCTRRGANNSDQRYARNP